MPDYVPELTDEERRLIDEHLDFYHALATGRRKPRTEAQRHFVAVCEGKETAKTPHEIAYLKHLKYEAHHPPRPRNENLPKLANRGDWCSNDGVKRMRAGLYGDMRKRHRDD